MKRPRPAVALVFALSVAVTACGSQSTAELDRNELTEVLVDAGLGAEEAECAADALVDADLTLDDVEALAAGEDIDDEKAAKTVTDALEACTSGGPS